MHAEGQCRKDKQINIKVAFHFRCRYPMKLLALKEMLLFIHLLHVFLFSLFYAPLLAFEVVGIFVCVIKSCVKKMLIIINVKEDIFTIYK